MPRDTDDDSTPTPRAPGWYPDPWSADGRGERYFDGKKWGTSERPLARHSGGNVIEIGRRGRRPRRIRRPSRTVVLVTTLVVAALGLTVIRNRHSSSTPKLAQTAVVPVDRPPASHEEAAHPLGAPPAAPVAPGKYEILEHQTDDAAAPVAWDPCRPIHYVVNPAGAPPDGAALLASAIARVHALTGFVFINDGTTTELPNKERHSYIPTRYSAARWAPVLIAWSNETAFPDLAGYIAGIGSPSAEYTDDGAHLVYVSGFLVLDSKQLSARAIPRRAEARAIILHELGHVIGLAHTSDRSQIMFSESEFNVVDYGAGDQRGLALLATQPCYPSV